MTYSDKTNTLSGPAKQIEGAATTAKSESQDDFRVHVETNDDGPEDLKNRYVFHFPSDLGGIIKF